MQTSYNIGEKIFIPLEGYIRAIEITEKGERYSIEIDVPFHCDPRVLNATNRFIMSKEEMIEAKVKRG